MDPAFRNGVAVGLYWLTLGNAQAAVKPPGAELEVTVGIYNEARISSHLLKKAESEAARLFREAHISVRWVVCPLSDSERSQNPECDEVFSSPFFFLKILPEAMAQRLAHRPYEYGLALQFQAYVYFDRLKSFVERGAVSLPVALGHMMAHEIGHLLLGDESHAPGGIMRKDWRKPDFDQADRGLLHFSQDEIRRIQGQIGGRQGFPAQ